MSILKKLFGSKDKPSATSSPPSSSLFAAARSGDLKAAKALINAQPTLVFSKDANDGGRTPLHLAVHNDQKAVVELLLVSKADINAKDRDGNTPLHMANNINIVKLLLAKGANVNAKRALDQTPLHYSAIGGNKDVVELLLAQGANVNAKCRDGWTPLRYAVHNGHKTLAEWLRKHGGRE